MTIERRALQGIAVSHLVFDPFLVQFLEGHTPIASYGGNQPHILLENLRLFHWIFIFLCKITKSLAYIKETKRFFRGHDKHDK